MRQMPEQKLSRPRHRVRRLAALFAAGALAGFIVWHAVPSPLPDAVTWPVSPALLDRNGVLFHARLSSAEEYCLPVTLDNMGKWLPLAAVDVEDRRFYRHFGVDPLALVRALWQNALAGKVVSGASTITSQVVRLTYPKSRTFGGKVVEFVQAVKLETRLSKKAILELYLNRAPFGGPVRGVEAAARSYFDKRASELSLAEAALLIGMLRGPSVYRPDKNPEKILARRNAIVERLYARRLVTALDKEMALLEKPPSRRGSIPQSHRHYADAALRTLPAGYWDQGAAPVITALDPIIQAALELRLAEALRPFPEQVTAAGGVMENANGALLAYVGNARFRSDVRAHWVDCGISPRSPGSLLKPFIYLKAMEQGKLLPGSLLADTPLSFSGTAPRNYDRLYRGPVRADFALANSLNAPAVRVLRLAGGESVIAFLRDLGFTLLARNAAHYGDSLALGGCEVTLLQSLRAFSGLAAQGVLRPVAAIPAAGKTGKPDGQRLFSAESAYLITESLRDAGRMPPMLREAFWKRNNTVAFKTGTSYGMRDAWTAAYTPEHTVVVWLGDPEGLPHPALSGLPIAAPAALEIIRDLPQENGTPSRHSPPPGLERFAACSFSGLPASPFCPDRTNAWRIRGVSRTVPCALHGMREGTPQVLLPPELSGHMAVANARVAPKERIDITMPKPGMRFFLTPLAGEQKIALLCEGAQGKIYWFVDQEFFGPQEQGATLLWPLQEGRHVVSLVDEAGNTASARFSVINILAGQPRGIDFDD